MTNYGKIKKAVQWPGGLVKTAPALALAALLLAPAPLIAQDDDFMTDFFMEAVEGAELPGRPVSEAQLPPKRAGKPPIGPRPATASVAVTPAAPPTPSAAPASPQVSVKGEPQPVASFAPKTGGKPPVGGRGPAVTTAVIEPERPPAAQGQTPLPPPPAAADEPLRPGERPLPQPPAPSGQNLAGADEDIFLSPDDLAGSGTEANSLTLPIDLAALPRAQWQTVDPDAPPGRFISDSPLPQFDAGESNWKQLEVGQIEAPAPPPIKERPASVPSVSGPPDGGPPGGGMATDRQHLRDLFEDMLPPPSQGARATGPSLELTEEPRPAEESSDSSVHSISGPVTAPPKMAAPEVSPPPPAPPENEEGGSAILKAGRQLSLEGHFGAAAILPPLENAPDLSAWRKEAAKAAAPREGAAPEAAPARPVKKAAPTGKAGVAPSAKPAQAAAKATPLTLVNLTGQAGVTEVYRSVLTKMGYTIAGVEMRPPAEAPTGQAVIYYRPGFRAKAKAVAGHLPGRKTLLEATWPLPTEITIQLR